MNPPDPQIARAVRVLGAYLENDEARIMYSIRRRRAMHRALGEGAAPDGYAPTWIHNVAMEIIQLLGQRGHEFNERFPWDKSSMSDFRDVLDHALGFLPS